jgi:hypothetical protein
MRINRYFLVLALAGITLLTALPIEHVGAIGIKTSSSGCKALGDRTKAITTLTAADNGKEIDVGADLYFDKDDYIILEWSAKDNNGKDLKVTGTIVIPDGGSFTTEATGSRVYTVTATGATKIKIKIAVADATNLSSISYRVYCEAAFIHKIIEPAIWP